MSGRGAKVTLGSGLGNIFGGLMRVLRVSHVFLTSRSRVLTIRICYIFLPFIERAHCLVYYLFDAFRFINEYSLIDRFVQKGNKVFCDALQE